MRQVSYGAGAAMVLALNEVPPDEIAADFGETDRQLANAYAKWISEAPEDEREEMRDELRCPPERILGVLNYLETKWGGTASYLEASGMSPVAIDRLSKKLE